MGLVIHAPNVHQGGGRTLLLSLLNTIDETCTVTLDSRFILPLDSFGNAQVIRVPPTLSARLSSEWHLKKFCQPSDTLLCFGNLPPLFRNQARVFVYLQNRFLSADRSLVGLPWRVRMRIMTERLWIRFFLRNATVLVQTNTMAQEVNQFYERNSHVMPFVPDFLPEKLRGGHNSMSNEAQYDFLYVASGEVFKNHRHLTLAWVELASNGLFPSLCLTLDQESNRELLEWINQTSKINNLRIFNNPVAHEKINQLYTNSDALIYPSLFESFGLPLLEAQAAGLPIIASEKDFVRDVVIPTQSFDPESPLSIARAVMRHIHAELQPKTPKNAQQFIRELLASA